LLAVEVLEAAVQDSEELLDALMFPCGLEEQEEAAATAAAAAAPAGE
jgi:hypothetical protein